MAIAIHEELSQWGPDANTPAPVLADAEKYCRRLATTHYENFTVVSWLLPRRLRQHFANVYAYCRWSDDLGDEITDVEESLRLLRWWREELLRCYSGEGTARHPVFVALSTTISQFDIPVEPFTDLLSAFEQDQHVTRYDTFDELRDYCRRSANPVGRLVLFLCGRHTPENVELSDAVCTGLQLANFWQDVARDWEMGRVYLPREDCDRFGYGIHDFQNRVTNDEFLKLMRFQVDRARELLQTGRPLIARMPGRLQVDIELFIRGGLKILERIEGIGYRVWETRPVVTKTDGVKLLLKSTGRAVARKLGFSRKAGHSIRRRAR